MPGYKTHLAGGIGSYLVIMHTLLILQLIVNPSTCFILLCFACSLAGSLFPDIDIKSKGQKLFYLIFLLVIAGSIYCKKYMILSVCSVASMIPLLCNHRGLFHRLWFVILFPLLSVYFVSLFYTLNKSFLLILSFFFIAGSISHLWLDFGFRKMIQRG